MQGKQSRVVATRIPDLNVQALASQDLQNRVQDNYTAPAARQRQYNDPRSFGAMSSDIIQKTLQNSNKPAPADLQNNKVQPVVNNTSIVEAGVLPNNKEEVIEYDLNSKSDPKKDIVVLSKSEVKKNYNLQSNKSKKRKNKYSKGKYYAQVGSFASKANANKRLNSMRKFNDGFVKRVQKSGKVRYRVLLGPFSSKLSANKVIKNIKGAGHEAILAR